MMVSLAVWIVLRYVGILL